LTACFQFAIERFSIDTKNCGRFTPIASHRGQNGVDVIAFKLLQRRPPRESLIGRKIGEFKSADLGR
jgi:hypothetical protein